jgi:hypothetical protein
MDLGFFLLNQITRSRLHLYYAIVAILENIMSILLGTNLHFFIFNVRIVGIIIKLTVWIVASVLESS